MGRERRVGASTSSSRGQGTPTVEDISNSTVSSHQRSEQGLSEVEGQEETECITIYDSGEDHLGDKIHHTSEKSRLNTLSQL